MSVVLRMLANSAVVLLALLNCETLAGEPPETTQDAPPYHLTTVCALTASTRQVAPTFRVVSGRISRRPDGFVLVDDSCQNQSLLLRESAPGILGETCSSSAPQVGLSCLLDSTKEPIFGTVSGMFHWQSGGKPTLIVWDVNDVSTGAPNNRWRGP